MRPLRSLLIMPANRADMLAKSPSYGADALVFDLEDSVPIAEKPKARVLAREYIEKTWCGKCHLCAREFAANRHDGG